MGAVEVTVTEEVSVTVEVTVTVEATVAFTENYRTEGPAYRATRIPEGTLEVTGAVEVTATVEVTVSPKSSHQKMARSICNSY